MSISSTSHQTADKTCAVESFPRGGLVARRPPSCVSDILYAFAMTDRFKAVRSRPHVGNFFNHHDIETYPIILSINVDIYDCKT